MWSSQIRDYTFWVYVINFFLSLYGILLFSFWGFFSKRASHVFWYVTTLFVGTAVDMAFTAYNRYLMLGSSMQHDQHELLVRSWIWPMKESITVIALLFIILHMTYRLVREQSIQDRRSGVDRRKGNRKTPDRRATDERNYHASDI